MSSNVLVCFALYLHSVLHTVFLSAGHVVGTASWGPEGVELHDLFQLGTMSRMGMEKETWSVPVGTQFLNIFIEYVDISL